MAINNYLKKLKLSVDSKEEKFSGAVEFEDGVNIIHAENGFGKSLIYSGIGWSLGLERMTVDSDGDNNYFSHGVTENLEIDGKKEIKVSTSRTELDLSVNKNVVHLQRSILPSDDAKSISILEETDDQKNTGKFKLGKNTFQNENIGFQSTLFKLFGWSPIQCRNYNGKDTYLYWENLGCLFFIDQLGGWNDIQSQQIKKYGILDVEEYAIEFVLGLNNHIKSRYIEQMSESAKRDFKDSVQAVYDRVNKVLEKSGDLEGLNAQGAKFDVLWKKIKEFNVVSFLEERIKLSVTNELKIHQEGLKLIENDIVNLSNNSKEDIYRDKLAELVSNRENLSEIEGEISRLSSNYNEDKSILSKLIAKLRSANDLLLLKKDDLGLKKKHHECPTCRQDIDPETNAIGNLSTHQVEAFINSTQNEKKALDASIERAEKEIKFLGENKKSVLKKIETLQSILGIQRNITDGEKARLISLLEKKSEYEKKITKTKDLAIELDEINKEIDKVKEKFKNFFESDQSTVDLTEEKKVIKKFEKKYRDLLKKVDLSIFKIDTQNIDKIRLDSSYRPIYEGKELKNLGSASDQARIIFPYVLALMDTALECKGNHPGFVILDEPIQQNPDEKRRPALINFITELPNLVKGQVIILTYLFKDELKVLDEKKIKYTHLKGARFIAKNTN